MVNISVYEVVWNMSQAGSKISDICVAVDKHRATIYRWIAGIKSMGLSAFIEDKRSTRHRRPARETPQEVLDKIVEVREEFGWCGQKICKELKEIYQMSAGVSTIYRWLHKLTDDVKVKKYRKHAAIVTADGPREVVEHDTVDLGGQKENVYAYTAIDIYSKEPSVYIASDLTMGTGATAFEHHNNFYGATKLHQSDGGSEFQTRFVDAVTGTGATHRYSRPYKKNEQAHIENFNKSLRNECFKRGGDYTEKDIPWLQKQADEFVEHYINRRWHMGLPDLMTPKQFREQGILENTEEKVSH